MKSYLILVALLVTPFLGCAKMETPGGSIETSNQNACPQGETSNTPSRMIAELSSIATEIQSSPSTKEWQEMNPEKVKLFEDLMTSLETYRKYLPVEEQQEFALRECKALGAGACEHLIPNVLTDPAFQKYRDYEQVVAQVAEGTSLAEGSKTAVAEFYSNVGHFPASNESAGVPDSNSIVGQYVSEIKIAAGGNIYVKYSSQPPQHANIRLDGKVLQFAPSPESSNKMTWVCKSGSISSEYLPDACSGVSTK